MLSIVAADRLLPRHAWLPGQRRRIDLSPFQHSVENLLLRRCPTPESIEIPITQAQSQLAGDVARPCIRSRRPRLPASRVFLALAPIIKVAALLIVRWRAGGSDVHRTDRAPCGAPPTQAFCRRRSRGCRKPALSSRHRIQLPMMACDPRRNESRACRHGQRVACRTTGRLRGGLAV